ncbi:hypothetical protein AAF712_012519 [Marasmius tenuissimus]|uniref:Uncharacterized protein n=1 Tax=Marasmius tenuissimus TaxID=585030 RepID=A0ABR2ZG94_9AGAR
MSMITNAKYYWDFVVFKVFHVDYCDHSIGLSGCEVEDELFKIPKHRFADNPHPPFKEMFTLPQVQKHPNGKGHKTPEEGTSPDNPIVLEQTLKVDFERFLDVLYPPAKNPDREETPDSDTVAQTWLSVLKLSSLWNFIPIRRMSIDRLSRVSTTSFTAIDRIVRGREYGVAQWFIEGIVSIAGDYLTNIEHADARRIGLDTTVSLFHFKSAIRSLVQAFSTPGADSDSKRGGHSASKARRALIRLFCRSVPHYFAGDMRDLVAKGQVYDHTERELAEGRFWIVEISVVGFLSRVPCRCSLGKKSEITLEECVPV